MYIYRVIIKDYTTVQEAFRNTSQRAEGSCLHVPNQYPMPHSSSIEYMSAKVELWEHLPSH